MIPSQDILPAHLIPVFSQYSLGTVKSVQKAYGMVVDNIAYIITTTHGKFVFKKRSHEPSLRYEVEVLEHLRLKKTKAEELVATPDKRLYVEGQGEFYLVVKFVEGKQPQYRIDELTPAMIKEAGKALAEIHGALKDLDLSGHKRRVASVFSIEEIAVVKAKIAAFKAVLDKRDQKIFTKAGSLFLEKYKLIQDQLDILRIRFTAEIYARLPHSIINGDYHPYNMFFNDAQVAGIIDWEVCYYGPRIFDLTHHYFVLLPRQRLDFTLVEGYEEIISNKHDKLNEIETLYLPEALRFRLLQSLYARLVMLFESKFDEERVYATLKDQLTMLEVLGNVGASKGIAECFPALTILCRRIKRRLKR